MHREPRGSGALTDEAAPAAPAAPVHRAPFDVVARTGPAYVFAEGPRPRGPADRHGAVDLDGERVAVLVQTGPSWPTPHVNARGEALVALRDAHVARAFFYGAAHNQHHYVVERTGGVALPALVRRVRKRAGVLPPVTCARIARDLARAQAVVDARTPPPERFAWLPAPSVALADAVVAWDGRVVSTPRMFGSPADAPRWLQRPSWTQSKGALLFALLAPAELVGADVDGSLLALLAAPAPLALDDAPALAALTLQLLAAPLPRARGRRATGAQAPLSPAAVAAQLHDIVERLGGDDESFAAALMRELFEDRRRADLAWREELAAAAL